MQNYCEPLRVLTYHRIDNCDSDTLRGRPELTVTPHQFLEQMHVLSSHYHVVSMDEVLAAAEGEMRLPKKAVLVTFDDAYCNVGEHAWPIMRKLGLPASIFVATAVPGKDKRYFWWDRLRAAISETGETVLEIKELGHFDLSGRAQRLATYKSIRSVIKERTPQQAEILLEEIYDRIGKPVMENEIMDWRKIKELAGEGVCFAPHSRSHPILPQTDAAQLENELSGPLEDLKQQLGNAPPVLAYPSGRYNQQVIDAAKSIGYRLGFTTEMRNDRLCRQDNLQLGRISLSSRYSLSAFRTILLPGGIHVAKGYQKLRQLLK